MRITRKHVFSFVFLLAFSLIQLVVFSSFAQPVQADESLFNTQEGMSEIGNIYGNNKTDVRILVTKFIQVILGLLASIFLILIIYAGFRYMTAAGNQDQTKKAISQIGNAVIGLIIVLAAWAITIFVIRTISRAVNNSVTIY